MTFHQKMLAFFQGAGIGVMAPVLTLFLLKHGCTLQSLALVMACYSLSVILMEVPSGILADTYGRRAMLVLSCVFQTGGLLLIFGGRLPDVITGMLLYGMGRAFRSGSADALIYDDAFLRGGQELLARTASSFLIWNSVGLSVGALAGGFLPATGGYLCQAAVAVLMSIVTSILGITLKERKQEQAERPTVEGQIRKSIAVLKHQPGLSLIMACIAGMSICMFTVETYWQPYVSPMLSNAQRGIMGILSSGGFCMTILGSWVIGRVHLKTRMAYWGCYLGLGAIYALAVGGMGRNSIFSFGMFYFLSYLSLGGVNVCEQTLINSMTGSETRAGILSVCSLFCQLGGVTGTLICSALLRVLEIRHLWIATAALLLFLLLIIVTLLGRGQPAVTGKDKSCL